MGVRELQELLRTEREGNGERSGGSLSRDAVANLAARFVDTGGTIDHNTIYRLEVQHQRIDPDEVRAVSQALGIKLDRVLEAVGWDW